MQHNVGNLILTIIMLLSTHPDFVSLCNDISTRTTALDESGKLNIFRNRPFEKLSIKNRMSKSTHLKSS